MRKENSSSFKYYFSILFVQHTRIYYIIAMFNCFRLLLFTASWNLPPPRYREVLPQRNLLSYLLCQVNLVLLSQVLIGKLKTYVYHINCTSVTVHIATF